MQEEEEVELVECKEARWDEGSGGCWVGGYCAVEVCSDGKKLLELDVAVGEVGSARRAGR